MKTWNIIGTLCPGNAASSFYSSANEAVILLHTAKAYRQFLIKNTFRRPVATLSFAYQIMDRDLAFDLSLVTGTVGLNDYVIYTFHNQDIDDHARVMMESRPFDEHFLVHKYTPIVYDMPHLSHLFESKGIFIYFFRFQVILGARHSIVNGSLQCKDDGAASLFAYDGPLLDMTKLDTYLIRLQEWHCGHTQTVSEKLQPSIGDLTLLLLINKTYSSNYTLECLLLMREIEPDDAVAISKEYMLPSSIDSTRFGRVGTLF